MLNELEVFLIRHLRHAITHFDLLPGNDGSARESFVRGIGDMELLVLAGRDPHDYPDLYHPPTLRDDLWRPSKEVERRWQFGKLLESRGLTSWAVEIGTHLAHFSQQLLRNWPGCLHCVDPYGNAPDYQDHISERDRIADFETAQTVLHRFRHEGRAVILPITSAEAAEEFNDAALDFVYLDGNHRGDYVRQDIALWWPKIKPGGILAGHDYNGEWEYQVRPAVEDFLIREGLTGYTVPGDAMSWYVEKPSPAGE